MCRHMNKLEAVSSVNIYHIWVHPPQRMSTGKSCGRANTCSFLFRKRKKSSLKHRKGKAFLWEWSIMRTRKKRTDNWWLSSKKKKRFTWNKAEVLQRDVFPPKYPWLYRSDNSSVLFWIPSSLNFFVRIENYKYFSFSLNTIKPLAPQSSMLNWLVVLVLLFPNIFYILFSFQILLFPKIRHYLS